VLVIICRGWASAINAKRGYKDRKNSTELPQLCSRYILKRYGAFTIVDCTFITYPYLETRLFYLQPFPLFESIKLMTASFSSLKKFSVAQIYETISKKTIPPWRASLIFLIMLSCLFDMNICCLQSDANTKYNEQIIFLLNNFWLSQNA